MAYATWMNDHHSALGPKQLRDVLLPGTHDSGTYAYNGMSEPVGFDITAAVTAAVMSLNIATGGYAGLVFDGIELSWDVMMRYTITQDRSIAQQLSDGIRYLDIRCQADGSRQYIFHGFVPHNPKVIFGSGSGNAKGVLDDVRDFLARSPRELVVIDFQEFKDMDAGDFASLFNEVKAILGGMLIGPRHGSQWTPSCTLDTLWGSNPSHGQAIVLFDTKSWSSMQHAGWDDSLFWKRGDWIASPWANTNEPDALRNFLYLENPRAFRDAGQFAVLQGQLTTISKADFTSLRSAAEASNPQLMDWLKTGRLGKTHWNVIIADYYSHGSGVDYVGTVTSLTLNGWPAWTGDDTPFWGGNAVIDALGSINKQHAITPSTDQGPSAAFLGHTLFVFYKGTDSGRLYMLAYDGVHWTGNHQVDAVTETMSRAPGVCAFTDADGMQKLMLVYKADGHDTLRSVVFDGMHWGSVQTTPMTSDRAPGLCAYTDRGGVDRIMCVFKDDDSVALHWAEYTISTGAWDDHHAIEGDSDISPQTQDSPAIVEYDGDLVVVYRGGSEDRLYLCAYRISEGKWHGNHAISHYDSHMDPASAAAPALTVSGGALRIVYRGSSSRDLFEITYDGHDWAGNDPIEDRPGAEIDPESNKSPALATGPDDTPWLVYKGSHSNTLRVAAWARFHTRNT